MRTRLLYAVLSLLVVTACVTEPAIRGRGKSETIAPATGVDKRPTWVVARPVDPSYFVGIGIAQKMGTENDYRQIAKDTALRDLASEITVNISGEFIHNIVEQSGMMEQEVRSWVRSSTEASLEGYELMDTWEDKNDYWVYYRLSKDYYRQLKQQKLEKVINLALDMFNNARTNEKQGKVSNALLFYLQAMKQLKDYISEPLQVELDGVKVFLMNEIYSSVQYILSNIELRAVGDKQTGKIGQPLRKPLTVSAIYVDKGGREITVSSLPIHFAFARGSGDMVEHAATNRDGNARVRITKITSTDRIQMVTAQLDVPRLIQGDFSIILQNMIKNLPVPGTKFMLDIEGLSAYITAKETHFGKRSNILYIEPKLKNALTNYGFSFVENRSKADIAITLTAASRKGSEMRGFHSAYVDLTISVIDMTSGDEIFKDALQGIKGVDLNYDKAGVKAFENAGEEIALKIKTILGYK
jgi:predicted transcriptional regulator